MAMEQYKVLSRVMPEATIERLVSNKKIEKTLTDYIITDQALLEEIFKRCLDYSIDPKVLIVPYICEEDNLLYALYTYVNEENYALACEVLDELYKKAPTGAIKLLRQAYKQHPDINEYILKENVFKDPAVTEGFHKLERKLVINLDMENTNEAQKITNILFDSYDGVVRSNYFENMVLMANIANKLASDSSYNGSFDRNNYAGETSAILTSILKSEDIYRAIETVRSTHEENPNSLEWYIYSNVIDQIALLFDKNTKYSQFKAMVNAGVAKSYKNVFSSTPYPGFTVSQIDEMNSINIEEFQDKDFFEEYEDAFFKEHNYKKAKKALINHIIQESIDGQNNSYEYLMEELDKLVMNEEDGVDLHVYNASFDFALSYIEKEDYDAAIPYASRMATELKYSTSRAFSLLAICYANLGDKEKASKWIVAAIDEGVAPSFIEEYIDVLYDTGKYEAVSYAANNFKSSSSDESVKVHYVNAAALLKQGLFDESKKELDECTGILEDEFNIGIPFEEEKKAIEDTRENNPKSFSYEDYVDYTLDDIALELSDNPDACYKDAENLLINLDKVVDKEDFDMKVDYLFTAARILLFKKDEDRAINILYGIEPYLNEEKLPKEKVKTYKKMFNNLKKG